MLADFMSNLYIIITVNFNVSFILWVFKLYVS